MSADLFDYEDDLKRDLSLTMLLRGTLVLTVLDEDDCGTVCFLTDDKGLAAAKGLQKAIGVWLEQVEHIRKVTHDRNEALNTPGG